MTDPLRYPEPKKRLTKRRWVRVAVIVLALIVALVVGLVVTGGPGGHRPGPPPGGH
jgi:ABC-type transporter Mla subunit MlaD